MKILKRGAGLVYRFSCDCCGSHLEAEREELEIRLGDTVARFDCPVCERRRSVSWCQITEKLKTPANEE